MDLWSESVYVSFTCEILKQNSPPYCPAGCFGTDVLARYHRQKCSGWVEPNFLYEQTMPFISTSLFPFCPELFHISPPPPPTHSYWRTSFQPLTCQSIIWHPPWFNLFVAKAWASTYIPIYIAQKCSMPHSPFLRSDIKHYRIRLETNRIRVGACKDKLYGACYNLLHDNI